MKKSYLAVFFIAFLTTQLYSQSGVSVNITGQPADTSAMLDVSSLNRGLLIPRLTLAQRNLIYQPATGLMVYQTDADTGFYYNAGIPASPVWLQLMPNPANADLNMNLNKIVNLASCTQNLDAANKAYVDAQVAGSTGGGCCADTSYQLSRVLLLAVSWGGTSYTVPSGKVWSVESSLSKSPVSLIAYPVRITGLNGNTLSGYQSIVSYMYSGNSLYPPVFPLWLPSGTTISFDVGSTSGQTGWVSVREFKIVVTP